MRRPVIFVILQTGARANGGLQSITEVMSRLKDHRPVVLTNLDSDLTSAWRNRGFDVRVVTERASAGFKSNPVAAARTYRDYHSALTALLESRGANVVHANDPLAFQLALSAAKWRGARIVLNLRDTLDPARRPPRLKYRTMFAAADHVFYLSHDMAERWRAVAGNAMRACSVTYSIVDPERFAPSSEPASGQPVVLVSGIFRPKKGQLEFIRNVVPKLAGQDIDTWFAGDFEPGSDPYSAECAAAAAPFGNRVRFLGFRQDLRELYARASVVAVPSRHEGLMRGMIEAMSCGCPVASFDVCSAREILEEKSDAAGTVVRSGDFDGMAEALLRYATQPEARALAGSAGSAAARRLFDPAQVVERYEGVYRDLDQR